MKPSTTSRKGATLRICEIYASVQGEGLLTGTPSVFLRMSGCNLRCWFCDTPFASWSPEGDYLTLDEIVLQVVSHQLNHVVITGGEPFIHLGLAELCERLHQLGYHLTIETAGTIFLPVFCDLISISPKLSSSAPPPAQVSWHRNHHQRRERIDVVGKLIASHPYQLKFVVDNLGDALEVLEYLEKLGPHDGDRVLLMPQGTAVEQLQQQAEWLIPWCREHNLRFCERAHIHWFGSRRGT
ncbi:MAG: radical SAM protein [Planctomycetales bacterium]|nr:radical SAM protein [Planctomycetales bacterium]